NVGHHYGSDQKDPWTIYWVHFTGSMAVEYFNYLMNKRFRPQMILPSNERNQLFDEIVHYASMVNNTDAVIYANNCLYNYLASFKNAVYIRSDTNRHQNDVVENSILLMKENLDKNLNLFEICRMMNLSVSHLSSLFKEKMHDSPYNYYIFLKIQRACYLLWNTQLNIKTIAAQLGYDDPYHFSRTFKNIMGLSPKQFRNRDE
ncbi:MAG: AraC family transcriptional regulator, partial [Chitinophagaceae bacterium]